MAERGETTGQVVTMVPQLGTDPTVMASGHWDMRLLSYIVNPDKIPTSFRPVLYTLVRRDVVINKKRFWDALADNYLVLVNSIEGRGRNDQIRAENALKKQTKGVGLGLHIVKKVVERFGGKIWFKSKEGKGTTFYFTIPFTKNH